MNMHGNVGGGLRLPNDVGTSSEAAATTGATWNTIDGVNAQLKTWGFHDNTEPQVVCPKVTPEALTTTDIKEYSTLFSAQLQWYNYASRLLADVRAAILQVKNEMDDIAVLRRTDMRKMNETLPKAEKLGTKEIDDNIESDPYYRSVKLQLQQLEQYRIKLDAWSEELDRNLKTVSRQIENRRAESEGGRRMQNMPGDANGRWSERRNG